MNLTLPAMDTLVSLTESLMVLLLLGELTSAGKKNHNSLFNNT